MSNCVKEMLGLALLPAARDEAGAVARQLEARPTTVLSGAAATTSAVRRAAETSRVVHFATHTVVSDTRPLESFLALAPGVGSDGRLTSAEIYGWRISADLVVLSACRTGRGRVKGDGVIGLSRAFAYAGALRTAQLALIKKLREGHLVVPTPAGPVTRRERAALWAPFLVPGEP